jgi:ABC-type multidrug transport system fused ATPase/permease subunit
VALAGPSGAGKSTLARLLLRFDDPAEGVVRLDGHDLRDLTLSGVRANVGLLLQETLLPDVTVREAIEQGRPGAPDADIWAALRAAGAAEFVDALPHGLSTRLGQRGRTLSGGQRQRLAIARALLRDTPVLVLDEPTTGLDAAARDALLGPLRTLAAGRTTIVISHDPDVLAWADRIVPITAAPEAPSLGAHGAAADAGATEPAGAALAADAAEAGGGALAAAAGAHACERAR